MTGETFDRRQFIKFAALGMGAAACPLAARTVLASPRGAGLSHHPGRAWERVQGKLVRCKLCPRQCVVGDGQRGYCGVRENQGGNYKTLVYARPCAVHVDPVEKKPLFHVLPSQKAFSIATAGCNVECQFCQNWRISQYMPEDVQSVDMPPGRVAARAKRTGCRLIAYTYSEPIIFYEYMLDSAREGNRLGLRSVMISNGHILSEPMKLLAKELAAVKVDLKGFTQEFYRKYVRGNLQAVKNTLVLLTKLGVHVEIVNLLIPGLNDGKEDIRSMCAWIAQALGPRVPTHFTRFHPAYKMRNLSPTPVPSLVRAREVAAQAGLQYAYVGNVPGHKYESTYCHECGKKIIDRYSYYVRALHVEDGKCGFCGAQIPGVWD
jgi:pyruvate formate lyase activating enzyme